jgi:hypothetical protein
MIFQRKGAEKRGPGHSKLAPHEQEVMRLLRDGLTYEQVANVLWTKYEKGCAPSTIWNFVSVRRRGYLPPSYEKPHPHFLIGERKPSSPPVSTSSAALKQIAVNQSTRVRKSLPLIDTSKLTPVRPAS